jgi:GNAT superfamily N-acetyltransferase
MSEGAVRLLSPSDILAAMRLKDAAGWNQTEEDWANLLEIEPEGCFGIDCDGVLAATATVVCYGRDLAWIGMVLTDPAFRRRGFARRLMEHAIDYATAREAAWIKLDATDMGHALYAQLGFEDECAVQRWARPPAPAGAAPPEFSGGFDAMLDFEAFGTNRTAVLWRASVESACLPGCAFALARPGSHSAYFGPCVSRTEDAARAMLEWFVARHGGESLYWDLLPGNLPAALLAREFGFEPVRRLVRMARRGLGHSPPAPSSPLVYAIAGFEFG